MAISITFLGAAGTVTGSRYLVETDAAAVLVDAGMFQERQHLGLNWQDYGVDPARLDAVVLTHGHMDHCGWLPKLVKDGFSGPVYATSATADLAPIIIRDIAKIQVEDARTKAKRHAKEGRTDRPVPQPLYDARDAEQALEMLAAAPGLDQAIDIAPGVTASWGENGHILGAAWIALEAAGRRLIFSGDIGNWDRPILPDPQPPGRADYLVMESTYGDRDQQAADASDQLRQVVMEAAARGGNLVIPSFSVERAQELLYLLSRLGEAGKLPFSAVYLDSPMAARVTALFQKHPEACDDEMLALLSKGKSPFAFAKLHYIQSASESKALNQIRGGAVIIAGNGMCTGGRIKHHLLHNLEKRGSTVLFVGFQAPGTLGRQLADGAGEVRLFNKRITVAAAVRQIGGMSGHADRSQLLRWADHLTEPPRRCFLTHGDPQAADSLAALLSDKKGWDTIAPRIGDRFVLE